jgi:hypothetical protein
MWSFAAKAGAKRPANQSETNPALFVNAMNACPPASWERQRFNLAGASSHRQ